MRDFLTGLAIILIVALSTMLVAPYFVDWNGQRGFLERELSRGLGQKVTIGGDIDLKLLPTPYLRLNQTVVGSDDGAVRVGIRHLDLELSVAPLLHGEFDIIEGHLDEPTIRVTLQPDRSLPALPDTPALHANVRLERLAIKGGTLAIADPQSGRTIIVDHLNVATEAPSLAGPFKGNGTFGSGNERTRFRFSTTSAKGGATHLDLALEGAGLRPDLAFNGEAVLHEAGDRVEASFNGTFVARGAVSVGSGAPTPWQLSGPLRLDPHRATLGAGELRIGDEDNGLVLSASGDGTFGTQPTFRVQLTAKELDLDRLAGTAPDATTPKPPQLPPWATLRRLAAAVTPPLPTTFNIQVAAATWGNEPLSDLSAQFTFGGNAAHGFRFAGRGPGGLQLSADADAEAPGGFAGHIALAADDIPVATRWLATVAPALSIGPRDIPFRSASIAGRLVADRGIQRVDQLALVLDGSKLGGTLRITPAGDGHPTAVVAKLEATTIELDSLPSLHAIRRGKLPVDLDLDLHAGAVEIAQLGEGSLRTGRVHLALRAGGERLTIQEFEADDLGGARVKGSGEVRAGIVSVSGTIDAAQTGAAVALAQRLAPGRITDALAARATSLAPAHLKIDGALPLEAGRRTGAARLQATGSLGGTAVNVRLAPDGAGPGVLIEAEVDAGHGDTLLRQIGLPVLPVDPIGPSRLALTARGPLEGLLDSHLTAKFGTSQMTVSGRFDLFGTGHGGSGTMQFSSTDTAPLLQTLALATPDLAAGTAATLSAALAIGQTGVALNDLKGDVGGATVGGTLRWQRAHGDDPSITGALELDRLSLDGVLGLALGPDRPATAGAAWSGQPFAPSAGNLPRSAVKVDVGTFDLGLDLAAHHASFDLETAPGLVTLKRATAAFAGGRLGGDVVLRRDGSQAALEASLTTHDVALDLPALKGKLDAKLDLAGSGQSALALVSSLAGSGEATATSVAFASFDPAVLPRIFNEVQNDTLAVDDESVRRAFNDVPSSSLSLGHRAYALGLAGGLLGFTAQDGPVAAGPIDASSGGSLDLRRMRADFRLTETLKALPRTWTGPVPAITISETGPPKATTRSLDVSAFINAVAAGAIARESARIESFEFDLRERAFFNARLAADRRREQDRQAEADARTAAEAGRRAAAAAAAEAARKAEAEGRRAKADPAGSEPRDGPRGADAPMQLHPGQP